MTRYAAMLLAALALAACGADADDGDGSSSGAGGGFSLELSGEAMGTTWSVLVVDGVDTAKVVGAIGKELDAVENEMSHYRKESEISRLNRAKAGQWFPVSRGFTQCMALAKVTRLKKKGRSSRGGRRS